MKKIYFLLLTILTTSISFGQIEVFNAGGGGAYPSAGWSDTNNVTAQDIDKTSYYLVEAGMPSDEIITDVYDLSAYTSAEFSLDVASYGSGTHNQAKIEISVDGGTTFTQTELSTVTTGSSYIDGGTFTLSSVTNQVQIKISNNAVDGRGVRLRNLVLTGISSDPFLAITAPSDNATFTSGTTSVDVSIDVQNFDVGATSAGLDGHIHWTVNGTAQAMKYDVADETIATVDGETYVVVMTLVDNTHTPISPAVSATVTFTVAYPCDLVLGTEAATCVAETTGTDTYNATLDFTGGGTSTYTITVNEGTVAGDDPSAMAAGTITINGVTEGTDLIVTIAGDAGDSSCNLSTTITSPTCVPAATCPNSGDVIITEIMKNPAAVNDGDGEYFEVYNTTASPIDMIGWVISDLDTDTHTVGSSVVVPAMGYAVFGINADAATNGGITVNYEYSGITMANGTDEVQIMCGGNVIDLVEYNDGDFPDTAGVAMELAITALDGTSNDDGANWGDATTDIGSGDLGTPGAANDFSLSIDNNKTNLFNVYPNPATNGFVNITSKTNEAISVQVFDILGKQVINQTVSNNTLNVAALNSGIYILKIAQSGNVSTKKLVIK